MTVCTMRSDLKSASSEHEGERGTTDESAQMLENLKKYADCFDFISATNADWQRLTEASVP